MSNKNKNIVLIGMPGAGKTTIGKLLAQMLNREFIDIDSYLEQSRGMSIPQMFAISEEFFREQEANVVQEISNKRGLVIATGGGVIKIQANMQALQDNGLLFFLNRSVDDIMLSLSPEHRPLLKDNPRERLQQLHAERYEKYIECADYKIDCSLNKLSAAAQEICAIINKQ